jgi:HSP20 family protein
MNRLLETAATAPTALGWAPATDMREIDDAYVIEAELPGVKRDDIEITES